VTLSRHEANTVLVDFKISNSLLSNDVRSDYQIFKNFFLSLNQLKVLNMPISIGSILSLRVLGSNLLVFNLLEKVLDIL
jgi:hypothetical protein